MKLRSTGAAAAAALALTLVPLPVDSQELILAFGDSITMGLGDSSRLGYPGRLQVQLSESGLTTTVGNFGIDGESTAEGLSRIDSVLQLPADAIFIMEGTNDVSVAVSTETIRFNLDQMAERAVAAGVEPIHATVIPRLSGDADDPDNIGANDLAFALRSLAWEKERRLVDPFETFLSVPDSYENLYLRGGDYWHLNDDGYEFLARIFHDVVLDIDTRPPLLGEYEPPGDQSEIPADTVFSAELYDFGAGMDMAETDIVLNGQSVGATLTGDETRARLQYQAPAPLVGEIVFGVRSADRADPPNVLDTVLGVFLVAGTEFLEGDLDRDGRVDGHDLIIFARAFGSSGDDSRYLPAADFDGDGLIDGVDLAVLASNFAQSSF